MSSKPSKALLLPADYAQWLAGLKSQISGARQRAVLSANREQIRLYHRIGSEILERQQRQGWGARVIGRLSSDLQEAFPEMKGFSTSNLKYMRYFAEQWPTGLIGQQTADQLPWFHIVILLTKLSDHADREWYARQAIANGWPRVTLELHIKNRLRLRQGAAITNFESRLPAPHANLAHETLKDPYHFDFLGLGDEAHERDIENSLIRHITRFLLELGAGFAFVGKQFRPTIGLLLCKTKKRLVAEYALSGIEKPIGIAEYQLVRSLPEPLDTNLPSIEEIEAQLALSAVEDEKAIESAPADKPTRKKRGKT